MLQQANQPKTVAESELVGTKVLAVGASFAFSAELCFSWKSYQALRALLVVNSTSSGSDSPSLVLIQHTGRFVFGADICLFVVGCLGLTSNQLGEAWDDV